MKTVLDQLDPESHLLLYAVGELSPDGRRRVEAEIAADPALRVQLDNLIMAQRLLGERLEEADARTRLPVDSRVAERHVVRMIQEWAAGRPERPPTVVEKVVGLKYPWWSYPLTAAAAVILAFLVWWGNTPMRTDTFVSNDPVAPMVDPDISEEIQLVDDLERSFTHPSQEGIRAAEGELYALWATSSADELDEQQEVSR